MISPELEQYISAASLYARSSRDPATTLVHVLLALLDDAEFKAVLSACGVNYLDLRQEAIDAIAERLSRDQLPDTKAPTANMPSGGNLSALCLYALQAAQNKAASRGSVYAGALDFVASILEVHDNGSFDFQARVALTKAGLTVGNLSRARKSISGNAVTRPDNEAQPRAMAHFGVRPAQARSSLLHDEAPTDAGNSVSQMPFCRDITELARLGKLDRSFGREDVLSELEVILSRRKKRNAILVGDPGVGKTSVVEELANRIIEGNVSDKLEGTKIMALNMGELVGGTKYRGDLEERVKDLVAILSRDDKAILFVDEIHVLCSPSHSASTAADILKPALASGEIRCVGATTLPEYKRFFESDGAMSRRFAPINVLEPNRQEALSVLKASASSYEQFHGVRYPDWSIDLALDLSIRHMPDRRLPDKAIELLDDIGARAAMQPSRIVTRKLVSDCVTAKTGRRAGDEEIDAAVAKLSADGGEVARATLRNALGSEPGKPQLIAVVGPAGVDKEIPIRDAADALGRTYQYLDMSEFSDPTSISSLLGPPPGYVGYDNGGRFYDVARRAPGGILHLRKVDLAHPAAIRVVEECVEKGFVCDKTGRVASLGGVQIVVSMDYDGQTTRMGFASSSNDDNDAYGIAIVDDAETLITISQPVDEASDIVKRGFAALVEIASSAGVRMALDDGVEEHVVSLLRSFKGKPARQFSRLVRIPVLDYLVSSPEDFMVESSEGGIGIRKHEAI